MIHEGIFFPSEAEKIEKLFKNYERKYLIKAFILPPTSLFFSSPSYSFVFSQIENKTPLSLFLPLHNEPLMKDRGWIWQEENEVITTPFKNISITHDNFPLSSYKEEESAFELLLLTSSYYLPNSPIRVFYVKSDIEENIPILEEIIKNYSDKGNVIGISSDIFESPFDCREERGKRIRLIEGEEDLFSEIKKNELKVNGRYLIHCSSVIKGRWKYFGSGVENDLGCFIRV